MNTSNFPSMDSDDLNAIDAIVLGAGISGLVSASILLEQGSKRVAVVDEYSHVGGNHIDRAHAGCTFDVGSFIFQDDSPLLRHFPELIDLYLPINPTWARLNPQGMVTEYPFSIHDDLVAAGPIECLRILFSALHGRMRRRPMANARDFARYWIGARLAHRSGLENYMERFCGLPAERIDLKFAEKRMLWIAEYSSVRNLARRVLRSRRRKTAEAPTNRQLARPREGFSHLYQPVVERLADAGVIFLLGEKASELTKRDGRFRLQVGSRTLTANRVVSTIPIDMAWDLCGLPAAKLLPAVILISLFYSFVGRRGFDASILYNFAHEGSWKRLTVYSDFYGRADGREYFAVEVIASESPQPPDQAAQDFRRHTAENGLLDGDLRLEGSHLLHHAYPIYTEGAGDRADRAIAALREFGLESFGRQGGFQYQPTARVSTLEAEAAMGQK